MPHTEDMKKLVDTLQKIDPRKEYSAEEIATMKLIPWATNYRTIIKVLRSGAKGWATYGGEAIRTTKGKHTRYYVRGGAIKNYLKFAGPYLMGTIRKPKQIYGKRRNNKAGRASAGTDGKKT